MRTTVLALSLAFGASTLAPSASASPNEEASAAATDAPAAGAEVEKQADALFDEGRELVKAGQIGAACKKFAQSHALRPGIGVLFNLADCNERLGKTGTAYGQYKQVVELTREAGQAEREKVASDKAAALEPRLVRLVLSVPPGGRIDKLTVDGKVVPPELYNKPNIVDPGEVLVRAEGPDDKGEPFQATIVLDEEGGTVTVAIPVGEGPKMKRKTGMIVAGSIVMGVGVLAAAAGGLAIAAGSSTGDDSLRAQGIGLGIAGLAVGGGVGVPLLVVGLKKRPVESAWLIAPEPSPLPELAIGPTSAELRWQF